MAFKSGVEKVLCEKHDKELVICDITICVWKYNESTKQVTIKTFNETTKAVSSVFSKVRHETNDT